MRKLCGNYAQIMHKLCVLCILCNSQIHMRIMRKLCGNYAEIMRKLCGYVAIPLSTRLCENYAKLCENYANYANVKKLCGLCRSHFADAAADSVMFPTRSSLSHWHGARVADRRPRDGQARARVSVAGRLCISSFWQCALSCHSDTVACQLSDRRRAANSARASDSPGRLHGGCRVTDTGPPGPPASLSWEPVTSFR
jgi:hypothetical protein